MVIDRGDEDHRGEFRRGCCGVVAFLMAVNEMDAVIDANTQERHHREGGEEIELDAHQRQNPARPDQAEAVGGNAKTTGASRGSGDHEDHARARRRRSTP